MFYIDIVYSYNYSLMMVMYYSIVFYYIIYFKYGVNEIFFVFFCIENLVGWFYLVVIGVFFWI